MITRLSTHVAATALIALLAGCASTPSAPASNEQRNEEAALILASDAYELHYRAGRVVFVDHRDPDRQRDVETFDEFRELYYVKKKEVAPDAMPSDGVVVNGWRGLDCLRTGQACGKPPTQPPSRDLIRLKLVFPQPPQ